MLPTSAGVEPATSWCPVGRASNCATEAGRWFFKLRIHLYLFVWVLVTLPDSVQSVPTTPLVCWREALRMSLYCFFWKLWERFSSCSSPQRISLANVDQMIRWSVHFNCAKSDSTSIQNASTYSVKCCTAFGNPGIDFIINVHNSWQCVSKVGELVYHLQLLTFHCDGRLLISLSKCWLIYHLSLFYADCEIKAVTSEFDPHRCAS